MDNRNCDQTLEARLKRSGMSRVAGDVIQSSYLNFERYGEKLCCFKHSMEMPMSANEAKSSDLALRELAGLLPDCGRHRSRNLRKGQAASKLNELPVNHI